MRLVEKLREYQDQYMFIRWVTGEEYCKLIKAGDDFVEVQVIDIDSMEYQETLLLQSSLILEVAIGGSDVQRIIAEISSRITLE